MLLYYLFGCFICINILFYIVFETNLLTQSPVPVSVFFPCFYGTNREKPVIDEIPYNSDYALRHLLRDNKIFDENLRKEVPVLDIIQQVFNNVNQHHSWIVAENQTGYDENQLRNAKVSMDNMFYVVFTKPHDENTSKKTKKNKEDKNLDPCFMPS